MVFYAQSSVCNGSRWFRTGGAGALLPLLRGALLLFWAVLALDGLDPPGVVFLNAFGMMEQTFGDGSATGSLPDLMV